MNCFQKMRLILLSAQVKQTKSAQAGIYENNFSRKSAPVFPRKVLVLPP